MRVAALVAVALWAGPWFLAGADAADRLTRYREVGLAYSAAESPEVARALAAELFALVDAEVLESVRSGGPFASVAFLREQLEALASTWGGMSLGILAAGPERGAATPLLVGVLSLAGPAPAGSVRVYGGRGEGTRVMLAATYSGRPEVHPWPGDAGGAARLAVSWTGAGAQHAGHPLWLEVWRLGAAGPEPLWRSVDAFPSGLVAAGFRVRSREITIRYATAYDGWTAGCPDQTETEDVFREAAAGRPLILASRRVINPWHRELRAALARLIQALAAGDQRAVAELVPDRRLRERIPARLSPEGACDQREDASSGALVAATETDGDVLRAWSLRWVRGSGGWRLTAATPVLQ